MMKVEENADLSQFSALRVGGTGRYFARIKNEKDLREARFFARQKNVPIFILGEGTNTFFADGTLDYLFLKIETKGIKILKEDDRSVLVEAKAGENWDDFVAYTVQEGWSGLEALSAIPGSVGASPFQNIGAYGAEVSEVIESVHAYDLKEKKVCDLSSAECQFRYRDSIFKSDERGRYIILSVALKLSKENPNVPDYEGVKTYLKEKGTKKPTLKEIREAIIEIRASKLTDPDAVPNLGSFFKNPVVLEGYARELRERFPDIKMYEVEGGFKVPAGWLIEKAFGKNTEVGPLKTWKNNALVLTNPKKVQSAEEVLKAQKIIKEKIKDQFGIDLEREPVLVE